VIIKLRRLKISQLRHPSIEGGKHARNWSTFCQEYQSHIEFIAGQDGNAVGRRTFTLKRLLHQDISKHPVHGIDTRMTSIWNLL